MKIRRWLALFKAFREEGDSLYYASVWASKVNRSMDQAARGEGRPLSEYLAEEAAEDMRVTDVEPFGSFCLRIGFADGTRGDIDLSDDLWGPAFADLRDENYFRQVTIDPDFGTIVWPNGVDFAPETLYRRVLEKEAE